MFSTFRRVSTHVIRRPATFFIRLAPLKSNPLSFTIATCKPFHTMPRFFEESQPQTTEAKPLRKEELEQLRVVEVETTDKPFEKLTDVEKDMEYDKFLNFVQPVPLPEKQQIEQDEILLKEIAVVEQELVLLQEEANKIKNKREVPNKKIQQKVKQLFDLYMKSLQLEKAETALEQIHDWMESIHGPSHLEMTKIKELLIHLYYYRRKIFKAIDTLYQVIEIKQAAYDTGVEVEDEKTEEILEYLLFYSSYLDGIPLNEEESKLFLVSDVNTPLTEVVDIIAENTRLDTLKTFFEKKLVHVNEVLKNIQTSDARLLHNLKVFKLLILTKLSEVSKAFEEFNDAIQYALKAKDLSDEIHGKGSLPTSQILVELCELYRYAGDNINCEKFGKQAAVLFSKLDKSKIASDGHIQSCIAKALFHVGCVYKDQQKEQSIKLLKESLRIFAKVQGKDSENWTMVAYALAEAYDVLKKPENALQLLNEIEKEIKTDGDEAELALHNLYLGIHYTRNEQFEEALPRFQSCIDTFTTEETKDIFNPPKEIAIMHVAGIKFSQGNVTECEMMINEQLARLEKFPEAQDHPVMQQVKEIKKALETSKTQPPEERITKDHIDEMKEKIEKLKPDLAKKAAKQGIQNIAKATKEMESEMEKVAKDPQYMKKFYDKLQSDPQMKAAFEAMEKKLSTATPEELEEQISRMPHFSQFMRSRMEELTDEEAEKIAEFGKKQLHELTEKELAEYMKTLMKGKDPKTFVAEMQEALARDGLEMEAMKRKPEELAKVAKEVQEEIAGKKKEEKPATKTKAKKKKSKKKSKK